MSGDSEGDSGGDRVCGAGEADLWMQGDSEGVKGDSEAAHTCMVLVECGHSNAGDFQAIPLGTLPPVATDPPQMCRRMGIS